MGKNITSRGFSPPKGFKVGSQTDEIAISRGKTKVRGKDRRCACGFEGSDKEFARHRYQCLLRQQKEPENLLKAERSRKFREWKRRFLSKVGQGNLSHFSCDDLQQFCDYANQAFSEFDVIAL